MRGVALFRARPAFQEKGGESMKSNGILLWAFCLMVMAPVAHAQSTTPTADPQAQSLKGFYNLRMKGITPPSIEPASAATESA